jgi:ring-1,2-phenylacetyl-CoA epoxidase subunit PaaD
LNVRKIDGTMPGITKEQVYNWLASVTDPEVPVLTITDLGIVRDVRLETNKEDGSREVTVLITPTYSGCPAMDVISMNIRMVLLSAGFRRVHIEYRLTPAWTTDWMTEEGKRKLEAYGIAPPRRKSADDLALFETDVIHCPRCGFADTELISQFGATSCKALYRCLSCREPFEHFKCH